MCNWKVMYSHPWNDRGTNNIQLVSVWNGGRHFVNCIGATLARMSTSALSSMSDCIFNDYFFSPKHILTRVDAYLSGVQRYQKLFCLMYVNNRLYSNKFNYFRPIVCHVQNRYSTTLDLQSSAVSHIMDQHCAECKRHRIVDSCVGSV